MITRDPPNMTQDSRLQNSNLFPVDELEDLEMVEELPILDTSIPLKIQTIESANLSITSDQKGSEYDELLMKADLSKLAAGYDASKPEINVEITFMTPDELKELPPAQMRETKLKILNDIRDRMGSEDEMIRYEALQHFSHYIDENNIILLNKMVTDPSVHVRLYLIDLVAKIKNNGAISILEVLKRDADTNISTKSLDLLAEIDPRYAKPVTTVDKKKEQAPQPKPEPEPQEKGGLGGIFKKF